MASVVVEERDLREAAEPARGYSLVLGPVQIAVVEVRLAADDVSGFDFSRVVAVVVAAGGIGAAPRPWPGSAAAGNAVRYLEWWVVSIEQVILLLCSTDFSRVERRQ